MNRIFSWCEDKLHKKAPISFCLLHHGGKTWAEKVFSEQVGEKNVLKSPLGRGYNLTIEREPREKRDIRALEHPWANSWRFCMAIWLLFCGQIKEKKKKTALFHFCYTRGLNPRPLKKWQNRMSFFASTLVPSSGTSPGFTGLGGNRGKYIFKVQLIFIAKHFLISEGLW